MASIEELSICGRWLFKGEPVEHFLGIVHARDLSLEKLGFNDASTMSGERSGVQIRLRVYSPSALYVHCRCHQLQLAAIHASKEHNEVMHVLGTLLCGETLTLFT